MAIEFESNADYVQMNDNFESLQENSTKTFSAWALSTTTTGARGFSRVLALLTASAGRSGYILGMKDGASSVWIGYHRSGTTLEGPSVVADTWTHLAMTIDGSSAELYVDGVSVDIANDASAPSVDADAHDAMLGQFRSSPTPTWSLYQWFGQIAEVAFWDVALTASEVKMLAAGGVIVNGIPLMVQPDNLVAYWPCNQGADGVAVSGAEVLDIAPAGNEYDGTGSGPVSWKAAPVASFGVAPLVITEAAAPTGRIWPILGGGMVSSGGINTGVLRG